MYYYLNCIHEVLATKRKDRKLLITENFTLHFDKFDQIMYDSSS